MTYLRKDDGTWPPLRVGDIFSIADTPIQLPWWSLRRWRAWWKGEELPLQLYRVTAQYVGYAEDRTGDDSARV